MRRFRVLLLALGLALAASPMPAAQAAEPEQTAAARAPVARLTDTLLATMKEADALGFAGRYDKLAPVLREVFDFRFMARLSLGPHWGKLTPDQQDAFAAAFARLSITTFAARFDGYSGQHFAVDTPGPGPRGTLLVPTRLVRPDKEAVKISYLMRETERGWQAVDIYMKGSYSEIASRRSEYSSILKNAGFATLLQRVRNKAEEIAGTHDHPWDGEEEG